MPISPLNMSLDLSQIGDGGYLIKVVQDNQQTIKKLVIQH